MQSRPSCSQHRPREPCARPAAARSSQFRLQSMTVPRAMCSSQPPMQPMKMKRLPPMRTPLAAPQPPYPFDSASQPPSIQRPRMTDCGWQPRKSKQNLKPRFFPPARARPAEARSAATASQRAVFCASLRLARKRPRIRQSPRHRAARPVVGETPQRSRLRQRCRIRPQRLPKGPSPQKFTSEPCCDEPANVMA